MKNIFGVIIFSIVYSGYSDASVFANSVKINSIEYKSSGQLVVKFVSLVQENFGSRLPPNITKLRFDYLNWPSNSKYKTWWYKILPWTESDNKFDKRQFENCINWMIQNYKNNSSFQMGQRGGGQFEFATDANDEIVIPYLWFEKSSDGKEQICLIDLG